MMTSKGEDFALVLGGLRQAVENGYTEVVTDDPEAVAADIGTYLKEVEGWELERLVPLVRESQCVLQLESGLGGKRGKE